MAACSGAGGGDEQEGLHQPGGRRGHGHRGPAEEQRRQHGQVSQPQLPQPIPQEILNPKSSFAYLIVIILTSIIHIYV